MADLISKVVEAAKSLLGFMTWGKLILLLFTGMVTIVLILSYEKRGEVWTTLKADKFDSSDYILTSLTMPTKEMLKLYAASDPNIAAVQVLRTDFNKMIRDTVFFYSKHREFQQEFENFHENKKSPTAVMAMNEVEQNTRMIAIINQRFICVPLTPSILKSMPTAPKYSQQVCSISVPPRYGDMVGYLTLWMVTPVDDSSIDYYHNLARILANEIYNKDIVRRP